MSASNVPVTSFAESKTLRDFVLLYTTMSILILALLGTIYFQYRKQLMLSEHRLAMQLQSQSYIPRLKRWMQGDDREYPIDPAYRTALYDTHHTLIHSAIDADYISWNEAVSLDGTHIHFIIPLASYELGSQYLVMETDDDELWLHKTWRNILLFGSLLFLALLGLGWYLSRLFLRPMREAITLLDHFIKDTTHELNTPVAAILNNVETLDMEALDERSRKRFRRIEIAARTISTIYDDLTYMVFNRSQPLKDELLDMNALLEERIEYFRHRCEQKRLIVGCEAEAGVTLMADRTRMTRLLDNLLSNAIKYNRVGGSVQIGLHKNGLSVEDSGVGIPADKLERVKERYVRFNEVEGGFGIGLHIVGTIADAYGWELKIDSEEGKGSRFTLMWNSLDVLL